MRPLVIFGSVEIRVLDDTDEGKSGIVDVQPIRFGKTVIESEHQADVAEILDAPQLRKPRRLRATFKDIGDDRKRRREQKLITADVTFRRAYGRDVPALRDDAGDMSAERPLAAGTQDGGHDGLGEPAETALEIRELLLALFVARAAALLLFFPHPLVIDCFSMDKKQKKDERGPLDVVDGLAAQPLQ